MRLTAPAGRWMNSSSADHGAAGNAVRELKVAFVMALAVGFPYVAYQVYVFCAGLQERARRHHAVPVCDAAAFSSGRGAGLLLRDAGLHGPVIQPGELVGTNVKAVYVPKVKEYYELVIPPPTCFGFAFQLPVVMALLSMAGVIQSSFLRGGRKYALLVIS